MNWDVELLSRIQFAFTIMFHYIFPPFSIGLGLLLVVYESLYVITKKKIYEKITRFWIKIFAANFSVGVASGIVMEFEFGTNWSTYSRFVGDIFGSPLAAEGIFAFFLESGFLAILWALTALQHLPTRVYGTLAYIEPATVILSGWLLFQESLNLLQLGGVLLILCCGVMQTLLARPAKMACQ